MPELIPITLFICIAAVLILRPITRRLGLLLEAVARERNDTRSGAATGPDSRAAATESRIMAVLEQMGSRIELLEERLDFTEKLLSKSRQGREAAPAERPHMVP